MPGKRMVRIATGSLSLIGDICQSNKERLDKQFDTQTSFFNNNGDNSEKNTFDPLTRRIQCVCFKRVLVDGKSLVTCSSYYPFFFHPLPASLDDRGKLVSIKFTMTFSEKPEQLPLLS